MRARASPRSGSSPRSAPCTWSGSARSRRSPAAKAELLEALPPDGHFVTNADDPRCLELAARATVPVTLFGIEEPTNLVGVAHAGHRHGHAGADAAAPHRDGISRVRPTPPKKISQTCRFSRRTFSSLTVAPSSICSSTGPSSPPIAVSAGLLGRHNVSNLLAAAAVGECSGSSRARIAEGLSRVEAPAHRLQPIHNRRAGVVVIDDAYNSNPDGAASALEVLREHPASRRLLVTPGMVELGELEAQLNRRFGEHAGVVCDVAILVGPARTAPIREGLASAGMDAVERARRRDIAEATALLGRLTRAGDVVLFENDLPDTYAEPR